jgi:hypothetical protein
MPVPRNLKRSHGLIHTDPQVGLLRVVGPHVDEGLVDLLCKDLLAPGVVSETGEEAIVAILVQDCSGFGVEEEELSILLGAYYEALFGRQDHGFNFIINNQKIRINRLSERDKSIYRRENYILAD